MENSQTKNNLKLFENKKIRYVWNAEEEDWYFSVIDVVEVLAGSKDYQTARTYWKVLKNRLNAEGYIHRSTWSIESGCEQCDTNTTWCDG